MQSFCSPVFAGRQVQVRSTPKPVTPFGGLVSLISFFERMGLAGRITELMPFAYTSNNAIPPAQTLVAFLVSVVAGARRQSCSARDELLLRFLGGANIC